MAPVSIKTAANDFLSFVNASPTPFHAVRSVKERLTSAGFKEIKVGSMLIFGLYELLISVIGASIMVVNVCAGWKVLLDEKWFDCGCVRHWEEMATGQPCFNDRSTH